MSDNKISIILLAYNQLVYTRQCLSSIVKNTQWPYEIIIIDNASTDGTKEYLNRAAQNNPLIRVITNEKNIGFTLAANQGMKASVQDYVVHLNNDTVVKQGWLNGLVQTAQSDPKIGIVGPRILFVGSDIIHTIGGLIHTRKGIFLPLGRGAHRSDPKFDRIIDCQYIEGSCMLIKREVIDRIGYFDEIFAPAYYEDTDYCFRARQAGYRTVCTPQSEIFHYAGKTYRKENIRVPKGGNNELIFRQRWEYTFPDNVG